MLVIAHRGANKEALENSYQAFDLAVGCGAARIELDVQLTKDGYAVVNHDDDLRRTATMGGRISEMTLKEIKKLRLRNGDPIPDLGEVVDRYLDKIELNIEIKGTSEKLAKAVCDVVGQHRLREKVIVSCFQVEPLVWIRKHVPDLKRACLWSSDTWRWPMFAVMAPQVFLEQCGTNILHPHMKLVTENLMDQARARGWLVYAWANMVGEDDNREAIWTALATYGLHGLCTNYPRQLISWLKEAELDEQQFGKNRRIGRAIPY
jgi:glycerophosphoryl diester phosphodiesterase